MTAKPRYGGAAQNLRLAATLADRPETTAYYERKLKEVRSKPTSSACWGAASPTSLPRPVS